MDGTAPTGVLVIVRVDRAQAEKFDRTLVKAAMEICPKYGVDPVACIKQAAEKTLFGKFAVHNNYFDTPEEGDLGHNLFIRIVKTGHRNNGGVEARVYRRGKYSSPRAAVVAYCERAKRVKG